VRSGENNMGVAFHPGNQADDLPHAGNSPVTALATGTADAVSPSTLTTITTLTAVGEQTVSRAEVSGTGPGTATLVLNAAIIETRRFNGDRTTDFLFPSGPLKLDSGDILDIKVEHFAVPALETRDYTAVIYGV